MTMNYLAVAASALAILGVAGGAHAASSRSSEASTVRVSLADLDLGRDEGAKAALQRIREAARRVCDGEPFTRAVDLTHPYVDCLNATVDHAVGVLGNPRVAALSAAHGRPPAVMVATGR